ncbi:hypothetical protein FZC66_00735 [Priestia megaterium]|nr:hypothetical protein FZC66_00735 [Priestia megaterium]
MEHLFSYDERLGIKLPSLQKEWRAYDPSVQQQILLYWETIRGHIPDRIAEVEKVINQKQLQLEEEENFNTSCTLNNEIAELASIINDLWIWYRANQEISSKNHT